MMEKSLGDKDFSVACFAICHVLPTIPYSDDVFLFAKKAIAHRARMVNVVMAKFAIPQFENNDHKVSLITVMLDNYDYYVREKVVSHAIPTLEAGKKRDHLVSWALGDFDDIVRAEAVKHCFKLLPENKREEALSFLFKENPPCHVRLAIGEYALPILPDGVAKTKFTEFLLSDKNPRVVEAVKTGMKKATEKKVVSCLSFEPGVKEEQRCGPSQSP